MLIRLQSDPAKSKNQEIQDITSDSDSESEQPMSPGKEKRECEELLQKLAAKKDATKKGVARKGPAKKGAGKGNK